MIRVLHVITGLDFGGAEALLMLWVRALQPPLFQHHVVCLRRSGPWASPLQQAGAQVHTLNMSGPLSAIIQSPRMVGLARTIRPDIVQGWMYHGNLAASMASWALRPRPPVVWGIHNAADWQDFAPTTRAVAHLNGHLSSTANTVLYVAHSSLTGHLKRGFCAGNARYLPGCIDCRNFAADPKAKATLRTALQIPAHAPLIGILARLHPMKDHANFLLAANLLPNGHFLLAGTGLEQVPADLRGYVSASLLPRLHFLGPRHDVAALLAGLSLCTLASRSGEALPLVLLEAMACETLAVATDVGDCGQLLEDVGRVVPPQNPQALATAWQQMLALSPEEKASKARRGKERVHQHYSFSHLWRSATALYHQVLGSAADPTILATPPSSQASVDGSATSETSDQASPRRAF